MTEQDVAAALGAFSAGLIIAVIVAALVMTVLAAVVWCMIFKRAGYAWPFGLLMFVPIANFVMMLVLAFSEWPIQRELRALRSAMPAPAAYPGAYVHR